MTKPDVPAAFEHLSRLFHQDVLEIYSTGEEALIDILDGMQVNDLRDIGPFLDELLSGRYSVAELDGIWEKTGSDCYFLDGTIEPFLDFMRTQIDVRLSSEPSSDP